MGIIERDGRLYSRMRISGEMLLQGQVRCMQGLLLAIARGVVPAIAVDHALSDDILDVVPVPEWSTGYVHEVKFEKWETKHRQVRTARPTLIVLFLFPKYNISCIHT
jgi:tRNA U38,U39,U40 pseudouridine synthase TruA